MLRISVAQVYGEPNSVGKTVLCESALTSVRRQAQSRCSPKEGWLSRLVAVQLQLSETCWDDWTCTVSQIRSLAFTTRGTAKAAAISKNGRMVSYLHTIRVRTLVRAKGRVSYGSADKLIMHILLSKNTARPTGSGIHVKQD